MILKIGFFAILLAITAQFTKGVPSPDIISEWNHHLSKRDVSFDLNGPSDFKAFLETTPFSTISPPDITITLYAPSASPVTITLGDISLLPNTTGLTIIVTGATIGPQANGLQVIVTTLNGQGTTVVVIGILASGGSVGFLKSIPLAASLLSETFKALLPILPSATIITLDAAAHLIGAVVGLNPAIQVNTIIALDPYSPVVVVNILLTPLTSATSNLLIISATPGYFTPTISYTLPPLLPTAGVIVLSPSDISTLCPNYPSSQAYSMKILIDLCNGAGNLIILTGVSSLLASLPATIPYSPPINVNPSSLSTLSGNVYYFVDISLNTNGLLSVQIPSDVTLPGQPTDPSFIVGDFIPLGIMDLVSSLPDAIIGVNGVVTPVLSIGNTIIALTDISSPSDLTSQLESALQGSGLNQSLLDGLLANISGLLNNVLNVLQQIISNLNLPIVSDVLNTVSGLLTSVLGSPGGQNGPTSSLTNVLGSLTGSSSDSSSGGLVGNVLSSTGLGNVLNGGNSNDSPGSGGLGNVVGSLPGGSSSDGSPGSGGLGGVVGDLLGGSNSDGSPGSGGLGGVVGGLLGGGSSDGSSSSGLVSGLVNNVAGGLPGVGAVGDAVGGLGL